MLVMDLIRQAQAHFLKSSFFYYNYFYESKWKNSSNKNENKSIKYIVIIKKIINIIKNNNKEIRWTRKSFAEIGQLKKRINFCINRAITNFKITLEQKDLKKSPTKEMKEVL